MTPAKQQEDDDRAARPEREVVRDKRRADALRANLKRRKAQSRGRETMADAPSAIPGKPPE